MPSLFVHIWTSRQLVTSISMVYMNMKFYAWNITHAFKAMSHEYDVRTDMRSFTWNRFHIQICDWFLVYFTCGVKLLVFSSVSFTIAFCTLFRVSQVVSCTNLLLVVPGQGSYSYSCNAMNAAQVNGSTMQELAPIHAKCEIRWAASIYCFLCLQYDLNGDWTQHISFGGMCSTNLLSVHVMKSFIY